MEKERISRELEPILRKLSDHLNLYLCKTETSLEIAQNRFDQVYNVLQPWNLAKQLPSDDYYDDTMCICESLKTDQCDATDNSLLDSISKTITTAQSLRSKNSGLTFSKVSTNIDKKTCKDSKTSSTSVKQKSSKSKQTSTTKSSTSQSKDSKDVTSSHNPSCPLYDIDESSRKLSNLTLYEAMSITKIPFSLTYTIKHCNKFLESYEKNSNEIKGKAKLNFINLLETQNKKICAKFEAQYTPSEIFMKYLSALHSYRNKQNYSKSDYNWVFYTDIKNIESFQVNRSAIITKESWNVILRFIIDKIIPALGNCKLSIMEKLYIQKMLKTVCNYTQSSIPHVPIFKLHHRE